MAELEQAVKQEFEALTDKEKDIRCEAFLIGYGTALQETKAILESFMEEVNVSLEGIKEQLEPQKQDETKKDEEKGEQ